MIRTRSNLRQLIDDSLPKRKISIERRALILAIEDVLSRWPRIKRSIKSEVEKLEQLSRISRALRRAGEKAAAALTKQGAEKQFQAAWQKFEPPPDLDPKKLFLIGASNELQLYLIAQTLVRQLTHWERLHGDFRKDPRTFAARLTGQLQTVICRMAGYEKYQFEQFLARISGQLGLPKLTTETLKKRQQRAKTIAGTK